MERLRLMHVIGSAGSGGAETFFLRLIAAQREICDVHPVVRRNSWVARELAGRGIPFLTAPFAGRLDPVTPLLLRLHAARVRPDVVQTWMNRASGVLPRLGIPSIGRLGGYYDLRYYRNLDWLVGNTERICAYIRDQGRSPDRTVHIGNFVESPPSDFRDGRASTRRQLGVSDGDFLVLLAGRLHPVKGFDVAIRALADLPARVVLAIAGEGAELQALETLAASLGVADRVRFLGWIANLTPVCAAADAWLVPSRAEPLGNTILEAWAHHLPVAATTTDGPVSLIDPGGTGLLFPAEDAAALAAAVRDLCEKPGLASDLAERGRKRFEEAFTPERIVGAYQDLYRRMMAAG